MAISSFIPYKFVLLTGAGFSYPFGGLLASEFRSGIFRRKQVQARPRVRELLLKEGSFETALATVRTDASYDPEDVTALESAVYEVFASMDADIAQYELWRDGPVNVVGGFQEFLKRFQCPVQGGANAGFIFTLNQDLMLEREWYNFEHWAHHPMHLGVVGGRWFTTDIGPLDSRSDVVIPTTVTLDPARRTNYVKLHGSMNWRSSVGERALVIGSGKTQQIQEIPLLAAYSEVFQEALMSGAKKLMVAGYSFQDPHINSVISRACAQAGLAVHIWDPYVFALLERIRSQPECEGIESRVQGTWSRKLHEVFPRGGVRTSEWVEIQQKFFDLNVS